MRAKPRVSPPSCATSHSRTYARGRCGRDNNKQKQNISYELFTVYFVSYTYERLRANRAYRLYIWWLLCIVFFVSYFSLSLRDESRAVPAFSGRAGQTVH